MYIKNLMLMFLTFIYIFISPFSCAEDSVILPSQTGIVKNIKYVDVDNNMILVFLNHDSSPFLRTVRSRR